jgi:3-oxoacyl-[acyl-carrier protein] reductase
LRKTILVAGASGAVGSALLGIARTAGWNAIGVYRTNAERAAELTREWEGGPGSLSLHRADLTQPAEVDALLRTIPDDECPDAIVHLAAPRIAAGALHRTSWDAYEQQIDGILKPVILLTQPLLARMLKRGHGRIIGVLSAAVMGPPPRGFSTYTTAKYALAGYLRCLAVEYAGRGISSNMVSPGPMETGLLSDLPALLTDQMRNAIPGGSWIDPVSVASAIFWLADAAGPEVSGCNLPVATGMVF